MIETLNCTENLALGILIGGCFGAIVGFFVAGMCQACDKEEPKP